jgi:hypothetical protein
MTLMILDSLLKLMVLRIDKINTTLESFGETSKKKRPTPGEESHTLHLTQILD